MVIHSFESGASKQGNIKDMQDSGPRGLGFANPAVEEMITTSNCPEKITCCSFICHCSCCVSHSLPFCIFLTLCVTAHYHQQLYIYETVTLKKTRREHEPCWFQTVMEKLENHWFLVLMVIFKNRVECLCVSIAIRWQNIVSCKIIWMQTHLNSHFVKSTQIYPTRKLQCCSLFSMWTRMTDLHCTSENYTIFVSELTLPECTTCKSRLSLSPFCTAEFSLHGSRGVD